MVLNIFSVEDLNYAEHTRLLEVEHQGQHKSKKDFPVFLNANNQEEILKLLSKSKPTCTPYFAISEVFNSYIINRFFIPTPKYRLVSCYNVPDSVTRKKHKGVIVPSYLQTGQTATNIFEYLKLNPSANNPYEEKVNYCVDVFSGAKRESAFKDHINYCPVLYNYEFIFNSEPFRNSLFLGADLATHYLLSLLLRNLNFHYENTGFIKESDRIVGLTPPIDQEFSLMFMYPDNLNLQKALFAEFNRLLTEESFITNTLSLIAKKYPEVMKKFLTSLSLLELFLSAVTEVEFDNAFIDKFSSEDFLIFSEREKALNAAQNQMVEQMKKQVESKRIQIDFAKDFFRIRKQYLLSINILSDILNQHLQKNHPHSLD